MPPLLGGCSHPEYCLLLKAAAVLRGNSLKDAIRWLALRVFDLKDKTRLADDRAVGSAPLPFGAPDCKPGRQLWRYHFQQEGAPRRIRDSPARGDIAAEEQPIGHHRLPGGWRGS